MKKRKILNRMSFTLILLIMFTTNVSAYIGPNWASSKESSPIGLYYDGYVQVSPGYRYNSQKEYSRG
ncbi:hypothetical protein AOC36_01200 [Erysipelothrix larvae]|uniref:Uncharacterized protein n=1 Tax=Erysipelothrix larvae TaxID=1514105 RepID=A0A120JTF0_9FIRM|nr:hypothetical protein [Erysipelothrix larvae]AMC92657.1 hypothetical protein AOC36_01200 [Erysipelothrix larvae]